jgi:hypothetical protein
MGASALVTSLSPDAVAQRAQPADAINHRATAAKFLSSPKACRTGCAYSLCAARKRIVFDLRQVVCTPAS